MKRIAFISFVALASLTSVSCSGGESTSTAPVDSESNNRVSETTTTAIPAVTALPSPESTALYQTTTSEPEIVVEDTLAPTTTVSTAPSTTTTAAPSTTATVPPTTTTTTTTVPPTTTAPPTTTTTTPPTTTAPPTTTTTVPPTPTTTTTTTVPEVKDVYLSGESWNSAGNYAVLEERYTNSILTVNLTSSSVEDVVVDIEYLGCACVDTQHSWSRAFLHVNTTADYQWSGPEAQLTIPAGSTQVDFFLHSTAYSYGVHTNGMTNNAKLLNVSLSGGGYDGVEHTFRLHLPVGPDYAYPSINLDPVISLSGPGWDSYNKFIDLYHYHEQTPLTVELPEAVTEDTTITVTYSAPSGVPPHGWWSDTVWVNSTSSSSSSYDVVIPAGQKEAEFFLWKRISTAGSTVNPVPIIDVSVSGGQYDGESHTFYMHF